jgi:hypothetical protein
MYCVLISFLNINDFEIKFNMQYRHVLMIRNGVRVGN